MRDWDDLKYFLAVAEHGTLTAAAGLLRVNHTTIARRIAMLENSKRVRLFDRSPEGYALTPAGTALVERARQVRDAVAAVDRTLAAHDTRLSGPLAITAPAALTVHILLPMVAEFSAQYPDIDIRLASSDVVASLSKREADIAIRATRAPDELLFGRRLSAYSMSIYCARHAWENADKRPIGWIATSDDPILPSWVPQLGFASRTPGCRVSGKLEALAAIKAGLGAAQIPCCLGDADRDNLIRLPGAAVVKGPDIWLLTHRDLRAVPRVQAFTQFLAKAFRRERALFEGSIGRNN